MAIIAEKWLWIELIKLAMNLMEITRWQAHSEDNLVSLAKIKKENNNGVPYNIGVPS